jgi:dihydroorotase-like cyclic amidohydrolase
VKCHIVHLSAAEALPFIRKAKRNGTMLTAETCYHYLTLNAEAIPDSATQYKCCPPVRSLQNRVRLKLNFTVHSFKSFRSDPQTYFDITERLKLPNSRSYRIPIIVENKFEKRETG